MDKFVFRFLGFSKRNKNMLNHKISLFNNDVDAVVCKTQLFEKNIENKLPVVTKIESSNPFVDFFNGDITYYTPGPLWKKSYLQSLGFLFNMDLLNVQEWEFYSKVLLKSPKINITKKIYK